LPLVVATTHDGDAAEKYAQVSGFLLRRLRIDAGQVCLGVEVDDGHAAATVGLVRRLGGGSFFQQNLVGFLDLAAVVGHLLYHPPEFGVGDLFDSAAGIGLEVQHPRGDRGHHHGDQHAWQLGRHLADEIHDHHGGHAHGQRRPVGITDLLGHAPDIVDEGLGAAHRHTDQLVDLRQADDHRRGIGETDDHRVRQEVDDDAELENAQCQLHHPDQQSQHDCELNELLRTGSCQWRQRRGGE